MIKFARSTFRIVMMWISALTIAGCTLDLRKWQDASLTDPNTLAVAIVGPTIATGTSATDFVFSVNYINAANVTLSDADITLSGADTAGCVAVVTGAGITTRTVTVSGCTGDGPVTISIAANSATDTLGNQALAYGPSSSANVQNAFIVRIDTTKLSAGSSANNEFTLPLSRWTDYEFKVDWGDGSTPEDFYSTDVAVPVTHLYATAGIYDIKIKGVTTPVLAQPLTLPEFQFRNSGDRLKILDVKQWGANIWWNMEMMFAGCENLQMSATDAPNLSAVTNLKAMFQYAVIFNGAIGHWDTSNVTNMDVMFGMAKAFNQPIGNWDISKVTTMGSMFAGAEIFNQNISTWDTSSLTDASRMFADAVAFNQPLNSAGGRWNTSNITSMVGMFVNARAFNQPINNWNTSSVTQMDRMFDGALIFNQPLNNWNTSNVTDMSEMFANTDAFNQDIKGWNISSLTTIDRMFNQATAFNQNLSNWNLNGVSNVDYDADATAWVLGRPTF